MNRAEWSTSALTWWGLPRTADNMHALVAWIDATGSVAPYNPLGHETYRSFTDGFDIIWNKLVNKHQIIYKCLATGNDAVNTIGAVYHSTWGSKPLLSHLRNVVGNWPLFAGVHVIGE